MSNEGNQWDWVVPWVTIALEPPNRLALGETTLHFRALERFVNCGDSLEEYSAFGKAFSGYVPVPIVWNELRSSDEPTMANFWWRPQGHKLFLFCRDTLRSLWKPQQDGPTEPREIGWCASKTNFLLGLGGFHARARSAALSLESGRPPYADQVFGFPSALVGAWMAIVSAGPGAVPVTMDAPRFVWGEGRVELVTSCRFAQAFYLIFRQSWRAKVCPRCGMYFIASKPNQVFCSTVCSAGNRLASKLDWWRRVGAKRRKKLTERRKRRKVR